MERKAPNWESELWSYLSYGDGTNCPMYSSCQLRGGNVRCFSENLGYYKLVTEFIDEDGFELNNPSGEKFALSTCPSSGRIFQLVRRLAQRYVNEEGINQPPVPTSLITRSNGNIPIEVRQVPLKA